MFLKNAWFEKDPFGGVEEQPYADILSNQLVYKHFTHPVQENANQKIVQLLLDNGVDINQTVNGDGFSMTPYLFARFLSNLT